MEVVSYVCSDDLAKKNREIKIGQADNTTEAVICYVNGFGRGD